MRFHGWIIVLGLALGGCLFDESGHPMAGGSGNADDVDAATPEPTVDAAAPEVDAQPPEPPPPPDAGPKDPGGDGHGGPGHH